jgi:hypothetical protein
MRVLIGFCVALAIGCGACSRASQQNDPSEKHLYGVGERSCRVWVAERSDWPNFVLNVSWVEGFVSGVGSTGVKMNRSDANPHMVAWIDQYCAAHPLDDLATASAALVQTLKMN